MTTPKAIPRLFYLSVEHKPPQVPRPLLKYLPQADLLAAGASSGVNGAAALMRVQKSQLQELYKLGSKPNKGGIQEYRVLAAEVISASIDDVRDDLGFSEYLTLIEGLNKYVNGGTGQAIVAYQESALDEVDHDEIEDIAKWKSGFSPLDEMLGGLYQGILLLLLKPGCGKTSHMLSLMEEARRTNVASNLWFFEAEIPQAMMHYKMRPIFQRTKFVKGDRLVCGFVDIQEIVQRCIDYPDPNRILFIDSPDAIATGQDRRFALEEIYRSLNWIKALNKLIVVSSQPRRNDRTLSQESVSDSWAKAWYSDMIVSGQKLGRVPGSSSSRVVRYTVNKNRFGPDGGERQFEYDYADLTFVDNGPGEEDW